MNLRQSISENWRWIGPLVGALGSVMLAALVVLWTASPPEQQTASDIIADWNRTISKLGIEPVFPPEEDIYVGDIFAVVTEDHLDNTGKPGPAGPNAISTLSPSNPLLNRAVKIDHVDMTKMLKEFYGQLPVFSTTTPRPVADRDIWTQVADADPFVASPHKFLSLAAFPAFTIKTSNTASGDMALPLIGRLRFSGDRKDSEELEIVFAETYGIPTVMAAAILGNYCQDPYSQSACIEQNVRDHLSFLMGGKVKDLLPNSKNYRFEVELHFVYRAYLTRAINRRIAASVMKEANSERATPLAAPGAAAGAAPQGQPSTAAPGIDASGKSQSARESSLDRAFQRPIVFGYRAVKKSFKGIDTSAEVK
jgi:hypothetical protein